MLPENVTPYSETLTQRQRDVVHLLASGSTMKQAGEVLGIKARTIAFHKYRVMTRLHLQSHRCEINSALSHSSEICCSVIAPLPNGNDLRRFHWALALALTAGISPVGRQGITRQIGCLPSVL